MSFVRDGYVVKRSKVGDVPNVLSGGNSFLVKAAVHNEYFGSRHMVYVEGRVSIGIINLPPDLVGRRVRFKMEVVE